MLLIAGATGYIGGLLAERLIEQGRDVRCLAETPKRPPEGSLNDARSSLATFSIELPSIPL